MSPVTTLRLRLFMNLPVRKSIIVTTPLFDMSRATTKPSLARDSRFKRSSVISGTATISRKAAGK